MRKVNKIGIIISSIFILTFIVGISIYAYFKVTSSKDVTASTNITTENVINIASFDDLFANSKSGNYNDSNEVYDAESRKILKLTNSIELKADLIITNDIHLDLNGNILNLNNKRLTFKHGYYGCFSLYNGTIEKGSSGLGKIDIDLPHAGFRTSDVSYQSNSSTTTEANTLNIINLNPKYSAYSALYLVGNVIDSSLNDRVEFKNYDAVIDNSFALTQDKFITNKNKCILNSNTNEICSYIYKDIDLPDHYLSTDITIEYSLDDDTYIDEYGIVTVPTTSADATLTATISHENWDTSYSCAFKLHIVNLEDQTTKDNVALQLIKDYISEYYIANTLRVDETRSITNYYGFPNAIELPTTALGGNIEYEYSMTDYNNITVNTTSHPNNGVYVLEPNSDCFHLIVRLNDNQNVSLNMHSNYVSDYETIARLIINKLYGGSITVDSSKNQKTLYTLTNMINGVDGVQILDSTTKSYISTYNITQITYTLKSGTEAIDYYTLSDYLLAVKAGASPDIKSEALTMSFKFGSGAEAVDIDIDLYINYLAEGGNTLSGFLPYYTEANNQVQDELITEFEMPFCFGGGAPYVCYDIAYRYENTINYTTTTTTGYNPNFDYYTVTLGIPTCLDIFLCYGGQEYNISTNKNQNTSLTGTLDTYFDAAVAAGDAKYIFRLNAEGSFANNCDVILIYNYKFKANDNWQRYEYNVKDDQNVTHTYLTDLNISPFTISGGLFYNTTSTKSNAIHDSNFFKWIYNNFNPNENPEPLTTVTSSSFIPVGWLSQDIAIDITVDSTLSSVTDFYGIGNLKNVKKVNLSGKNLSTAVLTSLGELKDVTTLTLSGCGITSVTQVSNLVSVRELDISNNNIQYFDDLIKMTNLFMVVLYGNNADNAIIGSKGICNFQTYYDLIKNGVSVYNQVSTYTDDSNVTHEIAVLFADSDDYNDYVRLKALITQNKLSRQVKISELYKYLKNISIANIELKYNSGSLTWGYEGDRSTYEGTATKYVKARVKIGGAVTANTYYELIDGVYTLTEDTTFAATKTYYEVATEYTATYCYVVHTWESYTLVCKFYVDRY